MAKEAYSNVVRGSEEEQKAREILARHTDTVDVHLINQRDPSQRACMDVSGDSTADDAHLILWPCGNRTKQNQLFTMSTTAVDR